MFSREQTQTLLFTLVARRFFWVVFLSALWIPKVCFPQNNLCSVPKQTLDNLFGSNLLHFCRELDSLLHLLGCFTTLQCNHVGHTLKEQDPNNFLHLADVTFKSFPKQSNSNDCKSGKEVLQREPVQKTFKRLCGDTITQAL